MSVDSSYGSGYNAAPLTDGVRIPEPDVHWYDAAWASAEKATEHWVQIELAQRATARVLPRGPSPPPRWDEVADEAGVRAGSAEGHPQQQIA